MPLHDWNTQTGWEGLHLHWIAGLARHLKGILPPRYRAIVGTSPFLAVDSSFGKPDVTVESANGHPVENASAIGEWLPDMEVALLDQPHEECVRIEEAGRLVSAVEFVSPGNKDRPGYREFYASRYANYLRAGVHLLLVDVHPKPKNFSFARAIGIELAKPLEVELPPQAVSFRIDPPSLDGRRVLGLVHRPLVAGQPLPVMPLALLGTDSVKVDLEATYAQAADDAYLT